MVNFDQFEVTQGVGAARIRWFRRGLPFSQGGESGRNGYIGSAEAGVSVRTHTPAFRADGAMFSAN